MAVKRTELIEALVAARDAATVVVNLLRETGSDSGMLQTAIDFVQETDINQYLLNELEGEEIV